MNEALSRILDTLNRLGLRLFAAGSVASSIHGTPRFTQGADLVVQLEQHHIAHIAALTSDEFYMDTEEAKASVKLGRAFNLIHLSTATKIDIFPMAATPFHRSELARAAEQQWILPQQGSIRLPVASPEDTVLSKLVWYRNGGQVSGRQWSDVLGIASRAGLNWEYIREWAPELEVADLVERLFAEANQISP